MYKCLTISILFKLIINTRLRNLTTPSAFTTLEFMKAIYVSYLKAMTSEDICVAENVFVTFISLISVLQFSKKIKISLQS